MNEGEREELRKLLDGEAPAKPPRDNEMLFALQKAQRRTVFNAQFVRRQESHFDSVDLAAGADGWQRTDFIAA